MGVGSWRGPDDIQFGLEDGSMALSSGSGEGSTILKVGEPVRSELGGTIK